MAALEVIKAGLAVPPAARSRADLWHPAPSSSSLSLIRKVCSVSTRRSDGYMLMSRACRKTPSSQRLYNEFSCPFVHSSMQSFIAGEGMFSAWRSLKRTQSCGRSGVVTMVIPFQRGDARQQPPPDLPSYLFKNR